MQEHSPLGKGGARRHHHQLGLGAFAGHRLLQEGA